MRVTLASGAVSVDEYLSAAAGQTGYVQTIPVPNCGLGTGPQNAYGSMTTNNQYALFSCGVASSPNRIVARVDISGRVDTSTTYVTSTGA